MQPVSASVRLKRLPTTLSGENAISGSRSGRHQYSILDAVASFADVDERVRGASVPSAGLLRHEGIVGGRSMLFRHRSSFPPAGIDQDIGVCRRVGHGFFSQRNDMDPPAIWWAVACAPLSALRRIDSGCKAFLYSTFVVASTQGESETAIHVMRHFVPAQSFLMSKTLRALRRGLHLGFIRQSVAAVFRARSFRV